MTLTFTELEQSWSINTIKTWYILSIKFYPENTWCSFIKQVWFNYSAGCFPAYTVDENKEVFKVHWRTFLLLKTCDCGWDHFVFFLTFNNHQYCLYIWLIQNGLIKDHPPKMMKLYFNTNYRTISFPSSNGVCISRPKYR